MQPGTMPPERQSRRGLYSVGFSGSTAPPPLPRSIASTRAWRVGDATAPHSIKGKFPPLSFRSFRPAPCSLPRSGSRPGSPGGVRQGCAPVSRLHLDGFAGPLPSLVQDARGLAVTLDACSDGRRPVHRVIDSLRTKNAFCVSCPLRVNLLRLFPTCC